MDKFDAEITPKQWIARVYQWALGANIARDVVVHDDWICKNARKTTRSSRIFLRSSNDYYSCGRRSR